MFRINNRPKSARLSAIFPTSSPTHLLTFYLWFPCLVTFAAARSYDLPLPVLPAKCPDDFLLLPNSQHCYGFQVGAPAGNLQTWREANTSCCRDGGTLMHIPTQPSDATIFVFLRQKATQMGIPSAWVARTNLGMHAGAHGAGSNRSQPDNGHICTYVEFPRHSTDVQVNTVGCNQEKRNFICDIKIVRPNPRIPFRHLYPARKTRRYMRVLDTKNSADGRPVEPPPSKQHHKEHVKPPSTKQVNAVMPDNLSGLSKIPPVKPTELVKARGDFIMRMYGIPAVSTEMMEPGFLPVELDTSNISSTSLETAKALLLEIVADAMSKQHKGNSSETAKHLTIELLEEGHPIQCYYGVNMDRRLVACVGRSKIESCAKIVTRTGQVVRSCGLPGMRQPGCHHTIDGVVCYCNRDDCNSGLQLSVNWVLIFLLLASAAFRCLRNI